MHKVCGQLVLKIALCFQCLFVCLLAGLRVPTYIMCAIINVLCCHTRLHFYFGQLDLSTGVATMSSLALLQVQHPEKQRQCGHDDTRLTESRNARSEQLLVMPKESPD